MHERWWRGSTCRRDGAGRCMREQGVGEVYERWSEEGRVEKVARRRCMRHGGGLYGGRGWKGRGGGRALPLDAVGQSQMQPAPHLGLSHLHCLPKSPARPVCIHYSIPPWAHSCCEFIFCSIAVGKSSTCTHQYADNTCCCAVVLYLGCIFLMISVYRGSAGTVGNDYSFYSYIAAGIATRWQSKRQNRWQIKGQTQGTSKNKTDGKLKGRHR